TSADALDGTTRLAIAADRLGYHRFWVAEHHNMPIVASTSPPVLMAHLAAHTQRIRIGSGGVMLPNHPPLVVAEQIAMLEALYPSRIDLGIGRAPGTDPVTAAALRRSADALDAREFPQQLLDLMALLGDVREGARLHQRFRATPVATSYPPIFLLGSSGYSAQLAGMLGLPFVQAHRFELGGTDESMRLYRMRFQPSQAGKEPHVIGSANVTVAETEAEAQRPSLPGRTGRPIWLPTVEEAEAHLALEAALAMPTESIVGDPDQVVAALAVLAERTGADELMLAGTSADYDQKISELELIAEAAELTTYA